MPAYLKKDALERVREYLKASLPEATLETVQPASLLLVRTNYHLSGFGFPDGNWRQDYEPLYERFKLVCSDRGRQLDELDVNFVYCVPQPGEEFDRFCSAVETDVYFCRKFVVPLTDNIDSALARLPFLPLETVRGASIRPDPAQVFLRRYDIAPVLARNLVLPHLRGEEEIVNDCLNGSVGDPVLGPGKPAAVIPEPERNTFSAWIQSVEIENFRAYREKQVFELASKVTVLFGPNGFGKTSFFDAIDFAITGQIGRLFRLSDSQVLKVTPHLDSEPADSVVTLNVRTGQANRLIRRTVADPNFATLDGVRTDRKHILAAITTGGPPGSERVDQLAKLFRATHLFNQEGQELTRRLQEDCTVPATLISRMLAFEDYTNALAKTQKVVALLKKMAAEYRAAADGAAATAETERAVMSRLTQQSQVANRPATLDEVISSLRERLRALGIDTPENAVDLTVVRGWRATIEVQHSESTNRVTQLNELAADVARQPESVRALVALREQIAQKELAAAKAESERTDAERLHQAADQALTATKARLRELAARTIQIEWIKGNHPLYMQLVTQERAHEEAIAKLTPELQRLTETESQGAAEVQKAESAHTAIDEKLEQLRSKLRQFEDVTTAHPNFVAGRARVSQLTQLRVEQEKQIATARANVTAALSSLRPWETEEEQLLRQIEEADQNRSDLQTLLLSLEGHIHSGVCPVCAADYGAKDELIKRVRAHSDIVTAPAARARLLVVRTNLTAAREVAATAETKLEVLERQLMTTQDERETLEQAMAQFGNLTDGTGLFPEFPEGQFREELARLTTELIRQIAATEAAATTAFTAIAAARERAASQQQARKLHENQIEEKQRLVAEAREQLSRLRSDERLGKLSFDLEIEQISEIERTLRDDSTLTNDALAKHEPAAATTKAGLNAARQKATASRNELQHLRQQVATQEAASRQFQSRVTALALPASLTSEQLSALTHDETRRQNELSMVRDTASSLDVALDAATTAAAVARLADNVHAAEKTKADAEASAASLTPWLAYFEQIETLLKDRQSNAITSFTEKYGPRSSVIQRRLRPVYGFDDITLTPQPDGIVVSATRRGETLRPPDFFSQSQQQTLILALFLTACSSQTWSTFSPVLLDDPVSHFDDLNTYAFLDLLIGFIESPLMKRQFVLSTCDERLFQLARQKFRHLGEGAAFYTFTATGEGGPRVERS